MTGQGRPLTSERAAALASTARRRVRGQEPGSRFVVAMPDSNAGGVPRPRRAESAAVPRQAGGAAARTMTFVSRCTAAAVCVSCGIAGLGRDIRVVVEYVRCHAARVRPIGQRRGVRRPRAGQGWRGPQPEAGGRI